MEQGYIWILGLVMLAIYKTFIRMRICIYILISLCGLASCKTKGEQKVSVTITASYNNKQSLLVIKNTSKNAISITNWHNGRFEPLKIHGKEGQVIAKQGGWDLLEVDPNKFSFNLKIEAKQKKAIKVKLEFKNKEVINDGMYGSLWLKIDNKWDYVQVLLDTNSVNSAKAPPNIRN